MKWREGATKLRDVVVGRRNDQADDAEETALPRKQMISIWLTQFFQGVQITVPFTLSAYLVRRFQGEHSSEQVIGQLTGLLAAAAPFSRFISSFPWGYVSDYTGRKAVILLSNATAVMGILAYGASTTFVQALLARIIPGMLNGCAVALKSMLGEACDVTNQARGMALFTLGWGSGTIVGPLLGGLLAEPCDNYGERFPLCGPSGFFRTRPYLPPCLASALLGMAAFATNIILMDETLPRLAGPGNLLVKYSKLGSSTSEPPTADGIELPPAKEPVTPGSPQPGGADVIVDAGELKLHLSQHALGKHHQIQQEGKGISAEPDVLMHLSTSGSNSSDTPQAKEQADRRLPGHAGHQQQSGQVVQQRQGPGDSDAAEAEDTRLLEGCERDQAEERTAAEDVPEEPQKWYRDRTILKAVVGSSLVAFSWNFLDELTPLFVSAPVKQRGLGLPLEQFTYPIIFGGVTLVLYSLVLYPTYQKRVGPLHSCKVGLRGGIPAAILVPLASLFGLSRIAQVAVLCLAMGVKGIFKIMSMTSSMVLINIVAPKARMGAVNGMAMALSSLARALGPALSGSIWALVVSLRFAGQQFVGFTLMGIAAVATSFLYSHMNLPAGR